MIKKPVGEKNYAAAIEKLIALIQHYPMGTFIIGWMIILIGFYIAVYPTQADDKITHIKNEIECASEEDKINYLKKLTKGITVTIPDSWGMAYYSVDPVQLKSETDVGFSGLSSILRSLLKSRGLLSFTTNKCSVIQLGDSLYLYDAQKEEHWTSYTQLVQNILIESFVDSANGNLYFQGNDIEHPNAGVIVRIGQGSTCDAYYYYEDYYESFEGILASYDDVPEILFSSDSSNEYVKRELVNSYLAIDQKALTRIPGPSEDLEDNYTSIENINGTIFARIRHWTKAPDTILVLTIEDQLTWKVTQATDQLKKYPNDSLSVDLKSGKAIRTTRRGASTVIHVINLEHFAVQKSEDEEYVLDFDLIKDYGEGVLNYHGHNHYVYRSQNGYVAMLLQNNKATVLYRTPPSTNVFLPRKIISTRDSLIALESNNLESQVRVLSHKDSLGNSVYPVSPDYSSSTIARTPDGIRILGMLGDKIALITKPIAPSGEEKIFLNYINWPRNPFSPEFHYNSIAIVLVAIIFLSLFLYLFVSVRDYDKSRLVLQEPVSFKILPSLEYKFKKVEVVVNRLKMRSDFMLAIGILFAFSGIVAFIIVISGMDKLIPEGEVNWWRTIFDLSKPFVMLLFIETLAFFFLRQYRIIFNEYKDFYNVYLNIQRIFHMIDTFVESSSLKEHKKLDELYSILSKDKHDLSQVHTDNQTIDPEFSKLVSELKTVIEKKIQ